MRRTVGTAWVAESALAAMAVEAQRISPRETGGVLLGYWAQPHTEVVVTAVIGPGPQAIHDPTRFVPDHDYQEAEIARRYAEALERNAYLGDWHSHPSGRSGLSRQDRATLLGICTHAAARAPVPLMAILTPMGSEWVPKLWRFRPIVVASIGVGGWAALLRVRPFGEVE